jgi:hypothetical protein
MRDKIYSLISLPLANEGSKEMLNSHALMQSRWDNNAQH